MKAVLALLLTVLLTFPSAVSQTNDTWRSVRTNHLFVIGNADAEKLRQVAAWLEFFHSAFAHLVSRNVIDASVPTTVVIFRDDASFTPFKPRYQGKPANVAGFFQPGRDVNYIALSFDPTDRDPFSTAFHEYVHVHLRDNVPNAPLWLNEGLAELYGSLQFSGNEALLGAPIPYYLQLLRQEELLPLKTLFSIGINSPHYNEQEKSGIFYGESWALVHYLMLSDRGRPEQFRRFLQLVGRGDDAAKAIENAFGTSLSTIEEDLKAYARRGNLPAQRLASGDAQNYASYTAMQRSSLTDGEANYYLGDLLLHQGRYAEAKNYLSRSVRSAPDFAPAHYELALLDFITNQDLAEAVTLAEKAYKLAPSNEDYLALLEHIKRKRGDPSASSQAQESLKSAVTSQSVQTGSSSMLGGTGSVAIHDGRTVDSSGSLPTVDEVLKKYVDALGGADALKAITSRVMKGTVDFVGVSRGGSFESHNQAPNKMLDIIKIDPVGTVRMIYNGREGWTQSVEGLRKLNKSELAEIQRNAEIHAPLKLKSLYAKATLAGRSKIGYRDVYVLELQPAVGPVTKMYLDVETYLPARIDTVQTWGTTSLPVETYLDDWRAVDGVKYAFTFSQSSQRMTLNFTVTEIRHNVAIDAKLFEPPL